MIEPLIVWFTNHYLITHLRVSHGFLETRYGLCVFFQLWLSLPNSGPCHFVKSLWQSSKVAAGCPQHTFPWSGWPNEGGSRCLEIKPEHEKRRINASDLDGSKKETLWTQNFLKILKLQGKPLELGKLKKWMLLCCTCKVITLKTKDSRFLVESFDGKIDQLESRVV